VLSNTQLVEQLMLQHRMNSVVNPAWISANYLWTRAIMVEGVEALDHYGWKWWKKLPLPDMSQFHLELVDIWHFALSNELVHAGGDSHEAASNIRVALRNPRYEFMRGLDTIDLRHLDVPDLLHVLVGAAAFGEFHLTAFSLLMEKSGMTWDNLHKSYVAKNVLNIFRQAHGYKEGTYIKDWGGQEDNEVLTALLEREPELTSEEVMARLKHAYGSIQAAMELSQ
jgi:hypothetical protein